MRYPLWRLVVFVSAMIPLLCWLYMVMTDALGVDPGKELVDLLGLTALSFLLVTLAMTPLQVVSGWGGWIAVRRQLGLWCFAYALLHVAGFAVFILGLDLGRLLSELYKRPYMVVGGGAFVGLLLLAVTSNRYSMRRLGRRWKLMHRLVYGILGLALLHMLWIVRADAGEWLVYAVIGVLLLVLRVPFVRARLVHLSSS